MSEYIRQNVTVTFAPIETAPRDRYILIFKPGTGADRGWLCGRWNTQSYHQKPRPYWDTNSLWGVDADRNSPPTHWCDLPNPSPEMALQQEKAQRATTAGEEVLKA